MAKTTFSSGVIVTSQWLNGAQQIYFDGQDLDWHYPPLGISSMVTSGTDGLDGRYVTLATEQPVLNSAGFLVSGQPISGAKVVTGPWMFGYDPVANPGLQNILANVPKSYTTNDKYENANGIPAPTPAQKFAALDDPDILTKLVVADQLSDLLDNLEIDNGIYYSAGNPTCENYGAAPTVICPA
jgi:hypothetical protein